MFLPSRKACEKLGFHANTLRKFADTGLIEVLKVSGQRRYNVDKFIKTYKVNSASKKSICYCRVSSTKQKQDLERQASYLKEKYPSHEIIKDVGSGLNYNRKGLLKILEFAANGEIEEVVVAYKDRLVRFGWELIKSVIEMYGGKLVVLHEDNISKEEELSRDIVSIITVYGARIHGLRKYKSGDDKTSPSKGNDQEQEDKPKKGINAVAWSY